MFEMLVNDKIGDNLLNDANHHKVRKGFIPICHGPFCSPIRDGGGGGGVILIPHVIFDWRMVEG